MNLIEQDAPRSRFDGMSALAVRLAVRRVAAHDSKFSRTDFTRPQLLACLALKCALGLTCRGVCDLLRAGRTSRRWRAASTRATCSSLVEQAAQRTTLSHLYADAGYDSERLHGLCRDRHGIERFIPPVIRTRDGNIGTKYRTRMRRLPVRYRRRSHAELFFSALKRTTGPSLRAKGRTALLAYAIGRSHQRRRRLCYHPARFK